LTAVGVACDVGGGDKALSSAFAVFYVLGCLAAILAVRQSGVFTAVIQPPLILFVAVPFAYFVFHDSTYTGIKDTLINCGYPLIERFPLMFFTSVTVLVIGMIRWYLGAAARRSAPKDAEPVLDLPEEVADTATPSAPAPKPRRSATARATQAASAAQAVNATEDETARPQRRSARTAPTGSQRSSSAAAAGTGSRRSRHARPPETEIVDPAPRPRRRPTPPVDPLAEPRRRPRAGEPREPREPRERRPLPPLDRRTSAERPERPDRYDRPQRRERPDAFERPERPDRPDRPQRRPRAADYEPYEPPPSRSNGSGTHHPVSRVRYRGADDGESRTEQRTRPRPPRHSAPDSWEYDV
jgi:hypothetical protein